jgi:hypothetical protein
VRGQRNTTSNARREEHAIHRQGRQDGGDTKKGLAGKVQRSFHDSVGMRGEKTEHDREERMVMFRLEGSGGDSGRTPFEDDQREDDCGGAQWVKAAKVDLCCASIHEGGVRRSTDRCVASARAVKAGRVRRSDGTPEPSEQKDFCSAAVCLQKGKRRIMNSLCDAFPVAKSDGVRTNYRERSGIFNAR